MADVERGWAQRATLGGTSEPIYYGSAHPECDPDGDFHPPPDATLAEAIASYWAEIAVADRIYAAATLDDIERAGRATYSVRWILVHLIEEYARDCGHADLIRQAIDGAAGDRGSCAPSPARCCEWVVAAAMWAPQWSAGDLRGPTRRPRPGSAETGRATSKSPRAQRCRNPLLRKNGGSP